MIQIVTISAIFKHVWTCWYMSKLVQIQYDMNWIHRILKHVWTRSNKQFRFNIIQIVTIHMILKHVWHVQTYLNLSRFRMSIWANGTWNVLHWQSVWIASSKSSDQKWKPLQSFSEILSIKWLEMLLPKRFQLAVDANRDLPKSLPGCPFSCCMIICGQTATVFSLSFLLLKVS